MRKDSETIEYNACDLSMTDEIDGKLKFLIGYPDYSFFR